MINKNQKRVLLFFLVILLFAINYPILNKVVMGLVDSYEVGIVERVIDGDTLVINKTSIRLLGINTPEKGEKYYGEAKEYLENLTLYKLVKLKKSKQDLDLYKRKLRYIFIDGENINKKIVEKGLANIYFPSGKDSFYKDFKETWQECINKRINLCEKSIDACANCVTLKELSVDNQEVILKNSCSYKCNLTNWGIKDEGRKNFIFPSYLLDKEVRIIVGNETNTKDTFFWEGYDYVWTKTGDSIFLRDKDGGLVLWWNY
jgi:hypothetical protein